MLTKEVLRSNPKLAGMGDDILEILATMSENDENNVIANKVKEIHSKYDEDVFSITGVRKPGDVKSYDHVKDQLQKLTDKSKTTGDVSGLTTERDQLSAKVKDLEKKIADGSTDTALKSQIDGLNQQLRDKDSEIKTIKTQYETEKVTLQESLENVSGQLDSFQLRSKFSQAITDANLVFDPGMRPDFLKELLSNREKTLMSRIKIDNIPGSDGKTREVVRDEKGEIMLNPQNKMEPFTAGELWLHTVNDLISETKDQQGAKTGKPGGSIFSKGSGLNLRGVTTKVEADEAIRNHVMRVEGISKMDFAFEDRILALRDEYKVDQMSDPE